MTRSKAIIEVFENQAPQFFLWAPVFLACGIGFYFFLPFEPPIAIGCVAFLISLSVYALCGFRKVLLLFVLVILGFFAAQMRTAYTNTPILEKDLRAVMVQGEIRVIEDFGDSKNGIRIVLENLRLEGIERSQTPKRIRLRVRGNSNLRVGQRIQALCALHVPSGPVMPGAFDFRRHLFFQSIGAVGFVYKDIEILHDSDKRPLHRVFEKWRYRLTQKIEEHTRYPQAGVLIALLTGRKTAIDDADQEAMRSAGLAHMLAISGLHVGLFSGVVFFLARLIMAAIPGFSLCHPIKKYAAVMGILGAGFYMLLAGATIPVQRAFLMAFIFFMAIIFDRTAVSLRLVAVSAFFVLLFMPESLLSVSFQMSFSAVTCLVVFYELIAPYWSKWHRKAGAIRRISLYFLGVCLTTVIATFATAPFALFHFNRLAIYALGANLISVPILSFLIMPFLVFFLLFSFSGLEGWILLVAQYGVGMVLEVAHWASNLPGALVYAPHWPLIILVIFVVSFIFLCLWRGRLKYIAAIPVLVSFVCFYTLKQEDILISSDFKLIGFISENHMSISNTRGERFIREAWLSRLGFLDSAFHKWPKEDEKNGFFCDAMACRKEINGYHISYVKQSLITRYECQAADLVLAPFPVRNCDAPYVIDLFDVKNHGSHSVFISEGGIKIKNTAEILGDRPWTKGRKF